MNSGPAWVAKSSRQKKDGKRFEREVGAVWSTRNPDVMVLTLDSIPAPEDGVFRIMLYRPDQARGQRPQQRRADDRRDERRDDRRDEPPPSWGRPSEDRGRRDEAPPIGEDLDDDIPF